MKQYIDLTQLSANQIGRMVCELNYNNISGLEKFYNSLGNLYGYPLKDTVNVYSRNLMLDKCELNKAFEDYSFKHFVELMDAISGFLSVATTPLSDFQGLSDYVVTGYVNQHIGENISNITTLSNSLSNFCACNSRVVIGKGSNILNANGNTSGNNSVAIGLSATIKNNWGNSIAIGSNAEISASNDTGSSGGTIQLGTGTNLNSGSFQVKNHTLLDSNGFIPIDRLSNILSDDNFLSALAVSLKPKLSNLFLEE